jgi:hypothetical protein
MTPYGQVCRLLVFKIYIYIYIEKCVHDNKLFPSMALKKKAKALQSEKKFVFNEY